MKYILALLSVFLLPSPANADGPSDYRPNINYYAPKPASMSYERQLQRDYQLWKRDQAEQREMALMSRKMRTRRLRELEAEDRYRASRARDRRLQRRYEAAERHEGRTERRDRLRREARALADERARYASQRRRYAVSQRYDEPRGAMCKPYVIGHGQKKIGRPRAERDARLGWVSDVESRWDRSYANPARAGDKRYLCDRDPYTLTPQYTCKFKARPCRGEF